MFKTATTLPLAHAQSEKSLLVLREGPVVISPSLAERILEETHFDGQRKTDPVYVQSHLESVNRGLWLRSPIAFCKVGYRYYLVNGKHRITMCSIGSRDLEFTITIHECKNIDEVISIYARYDTIARPRSKHQIINAYDLSGNMGVKSHIARAVYEAVPLLMNGLSPIFYQDEKSDSMRAKMNIPDIRNEAARAWTRQAVEFQGAIEKAPARVKKTLTSSTATAVSLMILRHSREAALDFLTGVANDDGLRKGDPRKTLLEYIAEGRNSTKRSVMWFGTPWNAFYNGETCKIIRCSINTPIKICGTPLDGRRR